MKRILRLFVLILVMSFVLPVSVEAKKPEEPKRVENYKTLLSYKLLPKTVDLDTADLDKLLNPYFDGDKAWKIRKALHEDDDDKIQALQEAYQDYKVLTLKQAKEDVDYLLDLMRIASLDYNRVGGDKAFKKFRKKVVKDIEEVSKTRQIYAIDLERAIARWMHFIDNLHFWVGSNSNSPHENRIRYIEKYGYPTDWRWVRYEAHFMCSNLTFQKEGEQYRCYENNQIVNLEKLKQDGMDMVRCWTNDFKVIYRLHYYGRTARKRPEVIHFKKNRTETPVWTFTQQVPLDMAAQGYAQDQIYDINGVGYINLTDNVYTDYDQDRVDAYAELGKNARDYNCLILDLRNNNGGFFAYLYNFVSGYLEKNIDYIQPSAHEVWQIDSIDDVEYYWDLDSDFQYGSLNYNDQMLITKGSALRHTAPGFIIVLTNNHTASCGDLTVDYLRHFDNAIIVGDATNGMMISDWGYKYFLPNSGMFISIPSNHRIWDPDYFQEARGFYPDIWMMTDNIDLDALTKYMREITPPRSKK